jgi:hypothetical protein
LLWRFWQVSFPPTLWSITPWLTENSSENCIKISTMSLPSRVVREHALDMHQVFIGIKTVAMAIVCWHFTRNHWISKYVKKSLKIPNGQSESVNRRRTEHTMAKRKTTKRQNDLQNTTQKTKDRVTRIIPNIFSKYMYNRFHDNNVGIQIFWSQIVPCDSYCSVLSEMCGC